jgi:Na+-translocating ferredoxin:NAD+ oxidoreductase subunit G
VRDVVRLAAVLFLVCAIAGGSLALVNGATRGKIAEYARREKQEALASVLPGAGSFTETAPDTAWDGIRDGMRVGSVRLASTQGYSGPIQVAVGLGRDGAVTGVRVLTQTETPGLGAKIMGGAFLSQFMGKTAAALALRKDDPASGGIDAISAATISSRAVTRAVREAVSAAAKGGGG